jgi:hypothetical protein
VIFPELALVIGAFSRLGRLLSVRVNVGQREIADGKLDFIAVGFLELVERFITETLAERSLVIGEFQYRDLGVIGTPGRGAVCADLYDR